MSTFKKVFKFFLDILSPKKCYLCKEEGKFLCNKCFRKQNNFDGFCYLCKRKSQDFRIHKKCLIENKLLNGKNFNNKKLYLDRVIVLTHYKNSVIKKLIIAFKFYGKKAIGQELGERLGKLVKKNVSFTKRGKSDHVILPVPLHFWRKLSRGFNQSSIISKEIGQLLNIRYIDNVVIRKKYTRQQSKLSQQKRLDNLNQAFKISKNKLDKIDKKIIILVDDVVSSGTTLNEIAKLLKQHGAQKVIGVCLASN